ncbi:MAG TPA: cytochrome d ubiquinol oxidase subunit II [Burkholderiales bacterium]|nr:cytochrome d ubiquinol oxidase subunit II [Burkholderiales bacterium]
MIYTELGLPLAFAALMGVAILAYVVLDGYDLGVGMLMPAASPEQQNRMVNSIGPFWDANETWLVLGVGILLVAFPAAHGVILQALYLPVAAMLVGLMLRGVAFEFRMKALGWHRELWNWLFWFGSFLASFAQGVMLGRYITGFAPGVGYYLFALTVGAALCGGYVLMGATWLIARTEGELQKKSLAWARWGLLWVGLGVALVSLATPMVSETVRAKWFNFPATLWLMLLPAATFAAGVRLWILTGRNPLDKNHEWRPFFCAVAIFVLAFMGLAYSIFPWVVIDRIGIWEASRPEALRVMLVGALLVLPLILAYNVLVYRIFRGKAREHLYD